MKAVEQLAFQRELLEQLHDRPAFRGPVIADFMFSSSMPNPPHLHTLPKNYLDLLGAPVAGLATGRKRLVFHDDRQVKVLSVSYYLQAGERGSTICAELGLLSQFRADLDLIERIQRDDFKEEERSSRFSYRADRFRDEREDTSERLDEALRRLRENEADKEHWRRVLSESAYQAMIEMDRRMAQEAFLTHNESLVREAVLQILQHNRKLRKAAPFTLTFGGKRIRFDPTSMQKSIRDMPRSLLLMEPVSIDLTHAPTHSGDGGRFVEDMRAAMNDFRETYPWLFPLQIPLAVIIMVVPPRNGVDLDNLARKIVPLVHDLWSPPRSLIGLTDPATVRDERLRSLFRAQIEAEKRFPKVSLARYEAIELPRTDKDPPSGLVRIALGNGTEPRSIRSHVDRYIKRWGETVD